MATLPKKKFLSRQCACMVLCLLAFRHDVESSNITSAQFKPSFPKLQGPSGNKNEGNTTTTVGSITEQNTDFAKQQVDKTDTDYLTTGLDAKSEEPTQPPSIGLLASRKLLFKVGNAIQTYWVPVSVVLGLVGNTLSLVVMLRPHNRRISCCVYMAVLAVSDNCILLIAAHYWVLTDAYNRFMPLWECKTFAYIVQVCTFFGAWVILAMTFDRFLAVTFPLKSITWCRPRRAYISSLVLVFLSIVYNIPYIIGATVINKGTVCASFVIKTMMSQIFMWVGIFINSLIPFTVLMILNAAIMKAVHNRKKFFQKEETSGNSGSSVSSQTEAKTRDRQLTIMLLLVTFVFLFLTLPQFIRFVAYSFFIDQTASPENYARYIFAYHFTNKLHFTNSAVNFGLYCLGGSKFRQDLVNALGCCRTQTSEQLSGNHSNPTVITTVYNSM